MTKPTQTWTRRRLLQATGLAAGGLMLPSLLGDRRAHAQAAPPRLGIFFTQHGPTYDTWRLRQPNLPDKDQDWEIPLDTLPEAEWSPVLQPLYAQRKNILVLDGLAFTSAFADNPGTNNHNAGTSHALTGAKMVRGAGFNAEGQGGGPSVDQVVANAVAVSGRIKSLYYSTAYKPWAVSFEGSNKPTAPECSPAAAFDRLFPAGSGSTPTPSEADRIRLARASVLGLVRNEYATLAPRLGAEDRQRLDQHRALIADLEAQIMGRGTVTCAPPAKPTLGGTCSGGGDHPGTVRAFVRLATAAMACDLTRVAVIDSGQLASADFGGPAGSDVHQDIAHAATPGSAAATQMANYYRLHATQFGELIAQFSSAGLLASSALMWITEIANGPHDLYRVMIVLAGGANGAFRTGRYLKYKETGANPAAFTYGGGKNRLGPAHSQVLVSLMQAMGLPNNSIGIASATGNLAGSGETVNLSGPLPRLR
jgi:hypothetical protein